jgi:hypothetical protein
VGCLVEEPRSGTEVDTRWALSSGFMGLEGRALAISRDSYRRKKEAKSRRYTKIKEKRNKGKEEETETDTVDRAVERIIVVDGHIVTLLIDDIFRPGGSG